MNNFSSRHSACTVQSYLLGRMGLDRSRQGCSASHDASRPHLAYSASRFLLACWASYTSPVTNDRRYLHDTITSHAVQKMNSCADRRADASVIESESSCCKGRSWHVALVQRHQIPYLLHKPLAPVPRGQASNHGCWVYICCSLLQPGVQILTVLPGHKACLNCRLLACIFSTVDQSLSHAAPIMRLGRQAKTSRLHAVMMQDGPRDAFVSDRRHVPSIP